MADRSARRPAVLSRAARQDIRNALAWSLARFGPQAAKRYEALPIQAIRDLEADPLRAGAMSRPELVANARTYHLVFSRGHPPGESVKAPRHFILYRIGAEGIEIGRILHDSRDLKRHLPTEFLA
jgi:toxin ParE1/3/4